MSLRLPDAWVWDTWFLADGDEIHAFFLHAPRSLGDPDLRHFNARIGHAVSRDLRTWTVLEPALGPGPAGAFDDLATWTGSVIRDGDGWLMAYSGVSRAEEGRVQRIGFARSADLRAWKRWGPVLVADGRWYETGPTAIAETHWRDPWLWRAPDGALHMLVTARADRGPDDERGVLGHAWSRDGGATWEVGPPLSAPGHVRELEVPQLTRLPDGRWMVLACLRARDLSAGLLARSGVAPQTGTVALLGAGPLGPFALADSPFVLGDPGDRWYAGRLVECGGAPYLVAWLDTVNGAFVGELDDPIPLAFGADGVPRPVGAPEVSR